MNYLMFFLLYRFLNVLIFYFIILNVIIYIATKYTILSYS